MANNEGTYDSHNAKEASLKKVISILTDRGASKIYIKKLAPNDNSKNQPYFGGHLTDLSFIPSGELLPSESTSQKTNDPKRKIKYFSPLKLSWIDINGQVYPAPDAKLIYYPQYPEVRLSGFLKGSKVKMSEWMQPQKQGRAEGRWLILGVCHDETIYAYLVTPETSLSKELEATNLIPVSNIFGQVDTTHTTPVTSTRDALIAKLLQIHNMGWIPSQKLNADGQAAPYKAQNGGGYTLEAQLGITPNGFAEPDYLGWEVKQFGVKRFPVMGAKPTTLMTPEPNGGIYKDQGAADFVTRYGYPDKSGKPDRLNFGGKHIVNSLHPLTNLTLRLVGFDPEEGKITDAEGAIALFDSSDNITASWSFAKLMDHWKRKHSQAVYIPCIRRSSKEAGVEYHYGKDVELGTGTNLEMVLERMHEGVVYYDPGIKLEHVSSSAPKLKRRSQFRIAHKHLGNLYRSFDFVDVVTNTR